MSVCVCMCVCVCEMLKLEVLERRLSTRLVCFPVLQYNVARNIISLHDDECKNVRIHLFLFIRFYHIHSSKHMIDYISVKVFKCM